MIKKYVKNESLANLLEWVALIAAAFVLFLFIQAFVFRLANITGPSMEPTLFHGEKVIITKFSYLFSKPKYGDIVAFPYKENRSQYYIKRIIGIEGDVIDFKDSRFIVNSEVLEDDFSMTPIYDSGDITYPYTVPSGCYFVLGDNRSVSKDSRYSVVSSIPKNEILGKISIRIWPLNKISLLYPAKR